MKNSDKKLSNTATRMQKRISKIHTNNISITKKTHENDLEHIQTLVNIIQELLDNDQKRIIELFNTLHPATAASLLQFLTNNEREEVISALEQNFDPEILSYLDDSVRDNVMDLWAVHEIAQKLEKLEGQDALKILEDLEKEERRALLRAVNPEIRVFLEEGLAYPENSAGRLMNHQVVAVPYDWNAAKIRTFLATARNLPDDLDDIIVVDKARKPIGRIPITKLVTADNNTPIKDIYDELEIIFKANENEKNIVFAFKTYFMKSAPVVDKQDKLIGIISMIDIIDMIYSDAQEEFLHSGGLEESDFYSNLMETSKARLKWLSFSIFGSLGVAMLIDSFRKMIAENAILVALMTIVTSISAVASIQVVTITIRALINRELSSINIRRTFFKELLVALINSLILGLFVGLIFGLKTLDYKISLLILISLMISMLFSAIAGVFFPVMFNRLGIDPGLSSGAFLNATMDALSTLVFFLIAKYMFI